MSLQSTRTALHKRPHRKYVFTFKRFRVRRSVSSNYFLETSNRLCLGCVSGEGRWFVSPSLGARAIYSR